MAFKVFISYSTHDMRLVYRLKQMLNHPPVEAFVAEYNIAPGGKLSPAIIEKIKSCDLFILLWSDKAKNSEWVPQEIGIAVSESKIIMPVVLEKSLNLPGFIKDTKYLAAYQNPDSSLQWLQSNVFERAQKKQKRDGIVWFTLGAAFFWLFSQNDEEENE
jgi:hypothetical protein